MPSSAGNADVRVCRSCHAAGAAPLTGGFDDKIKRDFLGGVRSGVNGTPSLFVNGQRYDGPRDVETLLDALMRSAADTPASQTA